MTRYRSYTNEQREQALHLLIEFDYDTVVEKTGIPRTTINYWARKKRIRTEQSLRTKNATEAAAERWHLKQERLIDGLMDVALDAVERRNQPHVEHVGQAGREVTYPKAPPAAFLAYVTIIEKAVRTLARLAEKSAARTEQAGGVTTTDAEYAALRAAMLQEMARRAGPLTEAVSGGSAAPEAPVIPDAEGRAAAA